MSKDTGYDLLKPFVGKWHTSGIMKSGKDTLKISGTDTYEWLPGNYFLLHKVAVQIGEEINESLEIIGYDALTETYPMQYFDHKGNTGTMLASYLDGHWTFLGDTLRFTGKFSKSNNVLSGIWEQKNEEGEWVHFMDISLERA